MAGVEVDDVFGDFASAGWSANFDVSVNNAPLERNWPTNGTDGASGNMASVSETSTNVESTAANGWNSANKSVDSTRTVGEDQSDGGFGDFSRFEGNGDATGVDNWLSAEASNSDGTYNVSCRSGVDSCEWPGEFVVTTVEDGRLSGEATFAEFGDFSSGNANEGSGRMEGGSSWLGNDAVKSTGVTDGDTFNSDITFGDLTTPARIESTHNGLDQESSVHQSTTSEGFAVSLGGVERSEKEMQSIAGTGTGSFVANMQAGILQTSNAVTYTDTDRLESRGMMLRQDKRENIITDNGVGQFSLLRDDGDHIEKNKTIDDNAFARGSEVTRLETCATQVAITDENRTSDTQDHALLSSVHGHTDSFGDFTSSHSAPSQDRHEFTSAFTTASVVESANESDNEFGDFSSTDGFAAFSSSSVVPLASGVTASSKLVISTSQQDDDDGDNGFGDFSSSTADDFSDFSSSSGNTGNVFGQFTSNQREFGTFVSPPQAQSSVQPMATQPVIKPTVSQLHIQLDSKSVQNVLISNFTSLMSSDDVQSGYKLLDLHLSDQNGSDWDELKKLSNEVKGRFNLNDCHTHQLLMDVLHVDVHAVLSPGFGGAQLQFFGDVGWLDSELLSPVANEMAVPVANTLLDLSASPMPATAPPLSQQAADASWAHSVLPELTNTPPMGEAVDVGMLDLDFFGASPASPATPSSGEVHGGLAMSDLQALGLILEPSSRDLGASTPPQQKETTQSSDPLAKVFALGGQTAGVWPVQKSMAKVELSAEAAAVVASLPDLSFMHSTVLMFPMQFSSMEHPVIHSSVSTDMFSSDLLA